MKMLMIVAREFMLDELEKLLRKNDITAYTILKEVTGKGKAGRVREKIFHTGTNVVILAVLPSDQVDKAVGALKTFVTARADASQGQLCPLKLFSLPCEELI